MERVIAEKAANTAGRSSVLLLLIWLWLWLMPGCIYRGHTLLARRHALLSNPFPYGIKFHRQVNPTLASRNKVTAHDVVRGSDFSSFPFSRVTKMKPLAVKAGSTVTTRLFVFGEECQFRKCCRGGSIPFKWHALGRRSALNHRRCCTRIL